MREQGVWHAAWELLGGLRFQGRLLSLPHAFAGYLTADAAARSALRAHIADRLAACDAAGLAEHVVPRALEALSRAVHLGVDGGALLSLMVCLQAG